MLRLTLAEGMGQAALCADAGMGNAEVVVDLEKALLSKPVVCVERRIVIPSEQCVCGAAHVGVQLSRW